MITALLLVLLVSCNRGSGDSTERNTGGKSAGNLTGRLEKLAWQEMGVAIDAGPPMLDLVTFLPGNLDSDSADELLLLWDHYRIYDLDGVYVNSNLIGYDNKAVDCLWDSDGDGVSEYVVVRYELIRNAASGRLLSEMSVVDLSGHAIMEFEGKPLLSRNLVDIDGNGSRELLVAIPDAEGVGNTVNAIDGSGNSLWNEPDLHSISVPAVGDVDGDGREEVLGISRQALASNAPNSRVFGMEQDPVQIAELQDAEHWGNAVYCADMDGDGKAEILTNQLKVLSLAGPVMELERPADWTAQFIVFDIGSEYSELEIDGQFALAALVGESVSDTEKDTVLIWDAQGRIVYRRTFKQPMRHLFVVSDGSQPVLILQGVDGQLRRAELPVVD